jgi:hypothetical protein
MKRLSRIGQFVAPGGFNVPDSPLRQFLWAPPFWFLFTLTREGQWKPSTNAWLPRDPLGVELLHGLHFPFSGGKPFKAGWFEWHNLKHPHVSWNDDFGRVIPFAGFDDPMPQPEPIL